ncbi:TPA: translesion error-prone DNA polymerase V autoproteolytic subunit [Escherichia coli]
MPALLPVKSHLVSLCATALSCTEAAADQPATAQQLSVHNGQHSHWQWFADRCQAGFPSPATDYAEQELDLNSYCISRPAATFFLRASGESMNQAGVQNGDLLVVDRAEKPQHGDIVIAEIDGEFTVKRLLLRPRPALEPVSDSPEFRTLYPENICIFGVVTHVIHRTRELR